MGISPATFCTWGPGTGTAFYGAAQFSNGSGSTITLESQFPNLFGTTGDYVEFDFLFTGSPASRYSFLGSTTTPDEIYSDLDSLFVTDGATTAQVDFDATLSADTWYTIKLYNTSGTLYCDIDDVQQADTATALAVDLDIIGKNQGAFTDVYGVQLYGAEQQYFSKSSPSVNIQGATTGFWRYIAFELTEVGSYTLLDNLSGNSGWRVEVVNVYFSTHKLRFTVGNGSETVTLDSTETFAVGDKVFAYVDLEDLNGAEPDAGDTTVDGTFSQYSTGFYLGATSGTSGHASAKFYTVLGDDGNLTTTETDWLFNSGAGRALDEVTASSTVSTSEVSFGYTFGETSGTRSDEYGTDDLTENTGFVYSATLNNGGFETLDGGGGFSGWTESASGTSSVNIESATQYAGTYAARLDIDGSGSNAIIRDSVPNYQEGVEYDFSVYSKVTGTIGSVAFRMLISGTNYDITYTSNDWTKYTQAGVTITNATSAFDLKNTAGGGANRSLYFDNLEVSRTSIPRVDGLRRSYLNAATFTGYMRLLTLHTSSFESTYNLYGNAFDGGTDENNGTASNVTWTTTDPGA